MLGWITDTFRLAWGALYWNTRKSGHISRGRRGVCPCQIASDSGRALETGCEGVLGYHSPARFRMVCPLLTKRPNGNWACSVDAAKVRPFWGRAAALYGCAILSLALVSSLVAFATLRGRGYDVSYRQVAWPPAWEEFPQVSSRRHLARAEAALAEDRTLDALDELSVAYALDPRNDRAGLLLAKRCQIGQPKRADEIYTRLFADFPERREEIALTWYAALLARGDFEGIQRLAGERLLQIGATPSPVWAQALLFATRRLGDPSGLERLLAEKNLSPAFAPLLKIDLELYSLSAAQRIEFLTAQIARTSDPTFSYLLFKRLLADDTGERVLSLLNQTDHSLGDWEKNRLRLDALAKLARTEEHADLVHQLLSRPTNVATCELLSSHFIAYANTGLLAEFASKLASEPIPAGEPSYPQLLAFFAACGVSRDPDLIRTAARRINAIARREYRNLATVQEVFLNPAPWTRPETFLPFLQPLPLEVTYALYRQYAPLAPRSP